MENSSKALLMAASMLIGVTILSLALYLFTYFSGSVNEMNKQIDEGQLEQFIITVTNLAKENNTYYQLEEASDSNFYITVNLNNKKNMEKEVDLTKMLTNSKELIETKDEITGENVIRLKKYQCKVEFNANTGRVNRVNFSD